jgi:hypothetical protein
MPSSPDIAVMRSEVPLSASIDDEVVMLDPATSRYFGVADTAARIWQLLAAPLTVPAIVEQLVAEYEVDEPTCTTEVTAFLDALLAAGLAVELA